MRSYPRLPLSKQDFINLLSMPEHAERAKADLQALAAQDDEFATVDRGTEDAPDLQVIPNPLPAWKRAGFASRDEALEVVGSSRI
ncbi:hypothetical protein [Bacteroides sp.]|uniref:hypothetical protein n=1 Tax=Bacteroides sp. TaxID=29523 RepID=UPI002628A013|nr:hypothetical protein [Bacteroides sp.]MDD3040757.1 hypothetical protein [Bacteroides sp.]